MSIEAGRIIVSGKNIGNCIDSFNTYFNTYGNYCYKLSVIEIIQLNTFSDGTSNTINIIGFLSCLSTSYCILVGFSIANESNKLMFVRAKSSIWQNWYRLAI